MNNENIRIHFGVEVDDSRHVASFITEEKVQDLLRAEDELGEFLQDFVQEAREDD